MIYMFLHEYVDLVWFRSLMLESVVSSQHRMALLSLVLSVILKISLLHLRNTHSFLKALSHRVSSECHKVRIVHNYALFFLHLIGNSQSHALGW